MNRAANTILPDAQSHCQPHPRGSGSGQGPIARTIELLILIAILLTPYLSPKILAHAGHNHGPEIAAPVVADVPPRFYAQSDLLELILVFPDASDPLLYVSSKSDNAPLAGATVIADVLAGSKAKVKVTDGPTSGSYYLKGLGTPETTVSLALEVTKGDIMDILSMDNILAPAAKDSASSNSAAMADGNTVFGLPRYLVLALIAMNAVIATVVLLAFLIWFNKLRRHANAPPPSKMLLLLLGATLLSSGPTRAVNAHAGDDHSGATLSAPVGSGANSLHFLTINAQFQADVRTTQIVQMNLPKSFRALGQVEIRPDQKAVVTPPAEGKLLPGLAADGRVPVQGDVVKKGDVLVIVDQIMTAAERVALATERAQVESDLNQARQELSLATRERDRANQLTNVIAAREVEEARAKQKIAEAKVNGLTNRLQTITAAVSGATGPNIRQVPILSPISGTISQSHAVLGEYVRTDKALFEIVNVEDVFVSADVFETDLGMIQNAKTARITLEAYPNESFSSILHSIGQQINPDTRSAHVLFAVKNPDQKLRGGMFANIEIESGTTRNSLVVPKSAIVSQDGVRQVFKKVSPESFQIQNVTVSQFRDNVAVVTEGLKAGDRVAVSGLYQIRNSPTVPAPDTTPNSGNGPK